MTENILMIRELEMKNWLNVFFFPSQATALLNKPFFIFKGPPSTVQCQAVKMEFAYPNSI